MKRLFKYLAKKTIIVISKVSRLQVFFGKPEFPKHSDIIENKYGHKLSVIKGIPCDAESKPLPWYTYPAIEYLKQLNLKHRIVFEWGSGNSSFFYSERAKEVYSIENNKDWYEKILTKKNHNQTIIYVCNDVEYPLQIKKINKKFDIIVIDGILRDECSKIAPEYLNDDGFIILDNSDRHPKIAQGLREYGFIQVDMHGFGPINYYTWTTSFFISRSFNFDPISTQPTVPIGGGY